MWYYKIDEKVTKDHTTKVLYLYLLEVTVPFRYSVVEFDRASAGDINEAVKPIINYSSLNKSRERSEVC
jgi:hypothetical protein